MADEEKGPEAVIKAAQHRVNDALRAVGGRVPNIPPPAPTPTPAAPAATVAPAEGVPAAPAEPASPGPGRVPPAAARLVSEKVEPAAPAAKASPAPTPAVPPEGPDPKTEAQAQVAAAVAAEDTEDDTPEPEVSEEEIEAQVSKAVNGDNESLRLSEDYKTYQGRIDVLLKTDTAGRVVGGEIPDLNKTIFALEAALDPEKFKTNLPELDEIRKEEAQQKLRDARADLREKKGQLRDLEDAQNGTFDRFNQRRDRIKNAIAKDLNEKAQAKTSTERVEKAHARGTKEWTEGWTEASAVIPPAKRDKAETILLREAKDQLDRGVKIPDLRAWLKENVKGVAEFLGVPAAAEEAATARVLSQVANPPAPSGAAAVAASTALPSDPRDRLRAAQNRIHGLTRKVRVEVGR